MSPGLVESLRRRFVDALQRSLFDEPTAAIAAVPESVPEPAVVEADGALRHPHANRRARIDGVDVHYAFARSRRRTIGFVVGVEGLAVRAPKWVTLKDIDAAVAEKGRWILAKLAEQREQSLRTAEARVVWEDGAQLPYLGRPVTLRLDSRHGLAEGEVVLDAAEPRCLHVGLPRDAVEERVRDAVHSWLQREARRIFADRAAHFSARLGVRVTRLSLSSAKTRWGSANANGSVRLNWRLVHHPLPTIDYVVAHELAHLREMNHGPRFWDVVASVVPDYEAARNRLRHDAEAGGR